MLPTNPSYSSESMYSTYQMPTSDTNTVISTSLSEDNKITDDLRFIYEELKSYNDIFREEGYANPENLMNSLVEIIEKYKLPEEGKRVISIIEFKFRYCNLLTNHFYIMGNLWCYVINPVESAKQYCIYILNNIIFPYYKDRSNYSRYLGLPSQIFQAIRNLKSIITKFQLSEDFACEPDDERMDSFINQSI